MVFLAGCGHGLLQQEAQLDRFWVLTKSGTDAENKKNTEQCWNNSATKNFIGKYLELAKVNMQGCLSHH